MSVAAWLLVGIGAYAGLGAYFAIGFAVVGAERIDPAARGASLGFRLMLMPAAAALWPLLLWKWIRS